MARVVEGDYAPLMVATKLSCRIVGESDVGRRRFRARYQWPMYIRTDCRKPASFAVALNWGIGSSSLNADVKAFDRLHNLRGSNSG